MVNIYKQLSSFSCKILLLSVLCVMAGSLMADFDGDGKADVFVARTTDAVRVDWWEGTGDIRTLSYTGHSFGAGASAVWAGDLDSDGYMDLLVGRGPGTGWGTIWYEATGADNGILLRTDAFGVDAINYSVGNVDDDGLTDLMYVKKTASGATQLQWYEITGDNSLAWINLLNTSDVQSVAIGDIDDGFMGKDILIGKSNVISWYEWNVGLNKYEWVQNWNNTGASRIEICNFDDDEYIDVISINPLENGRLKWWEIHPMGDGLIWTEINDADNDQIENNINFTDLTVADIDGDGISELMATRTDGTVVWIVAKSATSGVEVHGVWGVVQGTEFGGTPGLAIGSIGIDGPASVGELQPCGLDAVKEADFNEDCIVDVHDLEIIADQWLN